MVLAEAYNTDIFNRASRGAVSLGSASQKNTIRAITQWDRMARKTAFRNPASQKAVDRQYMKQYETNRIKFGVRWGPDVLDLSSADWKGWSIAEQGSQRGRQIASEFVAFRAQAACAAIIGGFGALNASTDTELTSKFIKSIVVAANKTAAAVNKISWQALIDTVALLGDTWQSTSVFVMPSKPFFDLLGLSTTNTNRLFSFSTVEVYSFLGKTFLVTDNPQLQTTITGSKAYRILALKPGTCLVAAANEFRQATDTPTGFDNLEMETQAQDAVILAVRNLRCKLTVPPTSFAKLALAASWETKQADPKPQDFFGSMLVVN